MLNSKCCFGLNCCFSSNCSFNSILFKTQSSWGDGIKSSWKVCGKRRNTNSPRDNRSLSGKKSKTNVKSVGPNTPNPAKGSGPHRREDSQKKNRDDQEDAQNGKEKSPKSNNSDAREIVSDRSCDFDTAGPGDLRTAFFNNSFDCKTVLDNAFGSHADKSDPCNHIQGDQLDHSDGLGSGDFNNSFDCKTVLDNSFGSHADKSDPCTHIQGDQLDHSDAREHVLFNDSRNSQTTISNNSLYCKPRPSEDDTLKHSYPRCTPPHIAALWALCEDCYQLNYKRILKERNNTCEYCEYHFQMNSPERIEFLVDSGTWHPIDEDMASPDPDPSESDSREVKKGFSEYEWSLVYDAFQKEIEALKREIRKKISEGSSESDSKSQEEMEEGSSESDSKSQEEMEEGLFESDSKSQEEMEEGSFESDSQEEEDRPYEDRLDSYRKKTGLNEAIQTGVGQINGIPAAFGIMEFEFMGGSMGSVVGEKIVRLIEYAINQSLPLIIVCASGGARMQEGSISLLQMAKISCALLNFDRKKSKLVYVSILASPTTGGVTASFGMLADIVLAEPNALIAFAGKRVIEETLKQPIPEGSQEAEPLFEKGMLDLIVPRKLLKHVLTDFFNLHGFNPLNSN